MASPVDNDVPLAAGETELGHAPISEQYVARKMSLWQRALSTMTTGGVRQSTLTLVCTAIGGGVLSMPYMAFLTGLGLGTILLLIGALLAYTSTVALMEICSITGKGSYSAVFSHCAGSWAGPTLDMMLFLFGNGACIGYLVLLSDFTTALVGLTSAPDWMASRTFPTLAAAALVAFPSTRTDPSVMSKVAPLSIGALAYVTIVIVARSFGDFVPILDRPGRRDMPWFNFSWHLPEAFAICVFAYNCHLNVVPVASAMASPTYARIRKVGSRVNMLESAFYLVMAIAGHLSFVTDTPQDILSGYDQFDAWIAIGRMLLSIAMLVAIPLNLIPTCTSGLLLCRTLCRRGDSRVLAVADAEPEPTWPRTMLALGCLLCQVLLAISVPNVAVVVSLLGGLIATPMILVIPAYCVWVVLPRTVWNNLKIAALLSFSLLSFASVPITFFKLAGIWNPPIHLWDKRAI